MTGTDTDTDDNAADVQDDDYGVLAEAAGQLDRAREQGIVDSTRESIAGWRSTGGMTLNAALAIDAVFLLAGAGFVTETTGILSILGWVFVGIGLLGVLEKGVRRLR